MADFDQAIEIVLSHEGGYTLDLDDPGGETNFGITKRDFPDTDIKNLTRNQAEAIYFSDYWNPHHFGALPQAVANRVFDLAVNIGPVPAIRLLQQSLGHLVAGPIVADGKIGPATSEAAHAADEGKLLGELRARTACYRCELVIGNPKLKKYLLGWFRRDLA